MKKHGVIITEHKRWNTKTVYNDGRVMCAYHRCPKIIRFKSVMVNDFNQHLCGGWFMPEIGWAPDVEIAIYEQIIKGRKPFGCMYFHTKEEAADRESDLNKGGILTRQFRAADMPLWYLDAAQPMTIGEIGDLRLLFEDYMEAVPPTELAPYNWLDILDAADVPLKSFFNPKRASFPMRWDNPPQPLWLTGLILGYPVENTISLYRTR